MIWRTYLNDQTSSGLQRRAGGLKSDSESARNVQLLDPVRYSLPPTEQKKLDDWQKYILEQDSRILHLNPLIGRHIERLIYIYRNELARLQSTSLPSTPEDGLNWMRKLSRLVTESSFMIGTLSEITANQDITEIDQHLKAGSSSDTRLLDVRGDYLLRIE